MMNMNMNLRLLRKHGRLLIVLFSISIFVHRTSMTTMSMTTMSMTRIISGNGRNGDGIGGALVGPNMLKKNVTNNNKNYTKASSSHTWISQESHLFNQGHQATRTHHLIMVAGHSVTISGHLEDAGLDETDWYLLDYQRGHGLPQAIMAHITAGIQQAILDPDSLLIFSGGETRPITRPLAEGRSYFHVADAMNLWNGGNNSDAAAAAAGETSTTNNTVRARTVTEEFATDSFENLLFSICRFHEVTGHYPTKITAVSYTFKQHRFEMLHAPALRFPANQFIFVGVDPPASTGFDLAASTKGELENAVQPFQIDPYGCHSTILQQKRIERNPYSRTPPYPLSCPEMVPILQYCGPELIPTNQVPWG